jgi:hypothetical protein
MIALVLAKYAIMDLQGIVLRLIVIAATIAILAIRWF